MSQDVNGSDSHIVTIEGANLVQSLSNPETVLVNQPVRLDPEITERITTTSLGSHSTLSSSMTPESVSSATMSEIRRDADVPVNGSPATRTMIRLSIGQNSIPPFSNPNPVSVTSGSSDQASPNVGVTQGTVPGLGMYQAPNEGKKLSGKLTTQYVMADGSVITGKGLGRGRPGVRRGPRRQKMSDQDSVASTPSTPSQQTDLATASTNTKRKRADSTASNADARSVLSSMYSRESSVEYNPTVTHTRSGRQTVKPAPLTIAVATPSTVASPVSKKVSTPMTSTPALKTHPKIKRKVYRGKEQFALCEHCLRGFGPPANVIVFCDACNKCWHQRCHTPQISKEVVADTKAEWFCATCDKILHGSKKVKKQSLSKTEPLALPPPAPAATFVPPPPQQPQQQRFGPPFVGAIALTPDQRKKYLEMLPREYLINLLLRAGDLAPQMPIFETPIIPIPPSHYPTMPHLQPQFTSDYVTPVTHDTTTTTTTTTSTTTNPPNDKTSGVGGGNGGNGGPPTESTTTTAATAPAITITDEGYDDTYDEHAALYPKVGEGVRLPPERDDLNMLLEGPESRTFSHWVRGMPVKTVIDTVPLHQSQFRP